jgi:hypothetical protein
VRAGRKPAPLIRSAFRALRAAAAGESDLGVLTTVLVQPGPSAADARKLGSDRSGEKRPAFTRHVREEAYARKFGQRSWGDAGVSPWRLDRTRINTRCRSRISRLGAALRRVVTRKPGRNLTPLGFVKSCAVGGTIRRLRASSRVESLLSGRWRGGIEPNDRSRMPVCRTRPPACA